MKYLNGFHAEKIVDFSLLLQTTNIGQKVGRGGLHVSPKEEAANRVVEPGGGDL